MTCCSVFLKSYKIRWKIDWWCSLFIAKKLGITVHFWMWHFSLCYFVFSGKVLIVDSFGALKCYIWNEHITQYHYTCNLQSMSIFSSWNTPLLCCFLLLLFYFEKLPKDVPCLLHTPAEMSVVVFKTCENFLDSRLSIIDVFTVLSLWVSIWVSGKSQFSSGIKAV